MVNSTQPAAKWLYPEKNEDVRRVNSGAFSQLTNDLIIMIVARLLRFPNPYEGLLSVKYLLSTCRRFQAIKSLIVKNSEVVELAIPAIIASVNYAHKPIGIGKYTRSTPLKFSDQDTQFCIQKLEIIERMRIAWFKAAIKIEALAVKCGHQLSELNLKGCKSRDLKERLLRILNACPYIQSLDLRRTCPTDVGFALAGYNTIYDATLLMKLLQSKIANKKCTIQFTDLSLSTPEGGLSLLYDTWSLKANNGFMDRIASDEWLFSKKGTEFCTSIKQNENPWYWNYIGKESAWIKKLVSSSLNGQLKSLKLTTVGQDTFQVLGEWDGIHYLEKLHLYVNKIEQINALTSLLNRKKITKLQNLKITSSDISDNKIFETTSLFVVALCDSMTQLKSLSLGFLPLSHYDFQMIVETMPHLRKLSCRVIDPITSKAFELLAQPHFRENLKSLTLPQNAFTEKILTQWTEKRGDTGPIVFNEITQLVINGSRLNDQCVINLLTVFPNLLELSIGQMSWEKRSISIQLMESPLREIKTQLSKQDMAGSQAAGWA